MKTCRTCKAEKPMRAFYRHPSYADGHMADCKECKKAYSREMHWLKREAILARQKRYYRENWSVERAKRAAYQRSDRGKQVKREVYRFARYGVEPRA